MIRIQQLKLPIEHTRQDLEKKLRRELRLKPEESLVYEIRKRSVDARKKPELYFNYVIDCKTEKGREQRILQKADKRRICRAEEAVYRFPISGVMPLKYRPVVIGTGPAGLFCGLMLALHGYRPLLLERGQDVDTRIRDVERFWEKGILQPQSNVQFGEGGAGTFSDGKLNTLVKDKEGRNREVLRLFVEAGAEPSLLYENKPHVGTDRLIEIVKQMRKQIEAQGGEVRFGVVVTDFVSKNGELTGLVINDRETIPCETAVFAIGHSARDTFSMLYDNGILMESKEFAAGFRVEHSQEAINISQYGRKNPVPLSAASYKVTAKAENGRNVYSFCMCPGGYVVNASSEPGRLAINGMSYHNRAGKNANSAIIVSVKREDFASEHPLAGIAFQRQLEEAAYRVGDGKIPVQRLSEFRDVFGGRTGKDVRDWRTAERIPAKKEETCREDGVFREEYTDGLSDDSPEPCMKGTYIFSDLTEILPREMTEAFLDGMEQFSHIIEGFGRGDTLISAVESRTSSPVRILRDETFQCNIKGIYPCGEGAGYAGGITSAAMDGMRIAEAIAKKYRPFHQDESVKNADNDGQGPGSERTGNTETEDRQQ